MEDSESRMEWVNSIAKYNYVASTLQACTLNRLSIILICSVLIQEYVAEIPMWFSVAQNGPQTFFKLKSVFPD